MKCVIDFVRESNAIEGIFDSYSLSDAYDAWVYCISYDKLTPAVIRKTHKILMRRQDITEKYKGHYRDCPVWVGGREGMSWKNIQKAVAALCKDMNNEKINDIFPKIYHIRYEKIHPFIDGNGRTGRIFMNWYRVKKLNLPILVIKESEKHE